VVPPHFAKNVAILGLDILQKQDLWKVTASCRAKLLALPSDEGRFK